MSTSYKGYLIDQVGERFFCLELGIKNTSLRNIQKFIDLILLSKELT